MLKQLEKLFKNKEKDKSIFDIIIYGSSVKGKLSPNDLDIVVIFLEGNLRERLDKIQTIKEKIKNKIKNKKIKIDIKQSLLQDLFSEEFFARSGIILEGISVLKNKKFSELLGFKGSTLFWYILKGLNHTEKVKFNYILAGRGTDQGIIKQFNGERLANGAVKIPIEKSLEFEEILKKNKIKYKKKNIMEET